MLIRLIGVGGAPGIALGRAFRYLVEELPGPAGDELPDAALARFAAAQAAALARLNALAERQRAEGYEQAAGIFEFQALLVEDPALTDTVTRLVRAEGQPLDQAVTAAIQDIRASIAALDDAYLSERAADVDAVGAELRRALRGGATPLAGAPPGAIVVAADLTPAETAELPAHIAGFATAYGGPTGHTAILARMLGIPAAVGLGPQALEISDGASLMLDGTAALLIVEPDAQERAEYERRAREEAAARARRARLREAPGQTADGHPVALWANIGRPEEARQGLEQGAEGIGLFRTEFLFLDRPAPPDELEQLAAYRAALQSMAGRPVVIRTLDIGGDKPLPYFESPREANPFLGMRGLRFCMRHPDFFATQLRALLRAAAHGDLRIMLPMVATPDDLAWGRQQMRAAAAQLAAAGLVHRADIPLGVMIETPAAALTADLLAREAAFFSVGSNDLAQYTLAVDRGVAELAARYPHDAPAVLRLIGQAAEAARRAGIPIAVCGELAGLPGIAPALVGLGISELSMVPAAIPAVKERLRAVTLAEARELSDKMTG